MSKSPFKLPARTEAPAALDEWVSGSASAAEKAAPKTRVPAENPPGKAARLTIDLPPELHTKFKAACAMQGTRMVDQVRAFIEEWTQKHG